MEGIKRTNILYNKIRSSGKPLKIEFYSSKPLFYGSATIILVLTLADGTLIYKSKISIILKVSV